MKKLSEGYITADQVPAAELTKSFNEQVDNLLAGINTVDDTILKKGQKVIARATLGEYKTQLKNMLFVLDKSNLPKNEKMALLNQYTAALVKDTTIDAKPEDDKYSVQRSMYIQHEMEELSRIIEDLKVRSDVYSKPSNYVTNPRPNQDQVDAMFRDIDACYKIQKEIFDTFGVEVLIGDLAFGEDMDNDPFRKEKNLQYQAALLGIKKVFSLFPKEVFTANPGLRVQLKGRAEDRDGDMNEKKIMNLAISSIKDSNELYNYFLRAVVHEFTHHLDFSNTKDDLAWEKGTKSIYQNINPNTIDQKILGYARGYGQTDTMEDRATIAEELFNPMGNKDFIKRCQNDPILHRKVEIITGCMLDKNTGTFLRPLTQQEFAVRTKSAVLKNGMPIDYFAKWSVGKMDAAYWNNLIGNIKPYVEKSTEKTTTTSIPTAGDTPEQNTPDALKAILTYENNSKIETETSDEYSASLGPKGTITKKITNINSIDTSLIKIAGQTKENREKDKNLFERVKGSIFTPKELKGANPEKCYYTYKTDEKVLIVRLFPTSQT